MDIPDEVLNDFRNHIFFCFKHLGLGTPTAMQYEIARDIQEGGTDRILMAGRGTGKSTITACLASWLWLKDPNKTFLVLSNTQSKAIDFVSQARRILSVVAYCRHLEPKVNDKDSALGFNVGCKDKFTQDLSCAARGITSQITGLHSDYIVLDDIEVSGKNESPVTKEALVKKLGELESIRNKGSLVLFLGTPHYQDSVYNTLRESYLVIKYPAEYPDTSVESEVEGLSDWVLALDLEAGDPTQPERFDKVELEKRKAKMGPAAYNLQYKLNTTLSDSSRYPLKLRDLIVLDIDAEVAPDRIVWQGQEVLDGIPFFGITGDIIAKPMYVSSTFLKYQQTIVTVDPSGRGEDETGLCVASILNGVLFIHEMVGLEGGYSDATLKKIASYVKLYNAKLVRVESNFGDGLFTKVLSPVIAQYCGQVGISEYRVTTSKEQRIIDSLEPAISAHRVVMNRKILKDPDNQYQISRIRPIRGSLKKDDRIDALAATVSYFKDHMAIDIDLYKEKKEKEKHENNVKQWSENFRASDYVNCSGATRIVSSSESPNKKRKNQWGW